MKEQIQKAFKDTVKLCGDEEKMKNIATNQGCYAYFIHGYQAALAAVPAQEPASIEPCKKYAVEVERWEVCYGDSECIAANFETEAKALEYEKSQCSGNTEVRSYKAWLPIALKSAVPAQELEYTSGHCEQNKQRGGCQLPNVHCGYPNCDRKLIAQQPAQEPVAWMNESTGGFHLSEASITEYEKRSHKITALYVKPTN